MKSLLLFLAGLMMLAGCIRDTTVAQNDPATDNPFAGHNTNGRAAIVLELSEDNVPISTLLVRDGETGCVNFGEGRGALGVTAEGIAAEGDSARISFSELSDCHAEARSDDFFESLELSKGKSLNTVDGSGVRAGVANLQVRLVDIMLAKR